jgi:predicted ATP-dependent serine protease
LGIVPEPAPAPKKGGNKWPPIRATYPYHDENNALLYEVVRFDTNDPDLRFRPRRPNGKGGWIYDLDGVRRVLYRLPELIEGIASGYLVLDCEGENDVEAARRLGYIATTHPEGINKWRDEYDEFFRDADVVVISDNDAHGKGQADAETRAQHLSRVAKRVRKIMFEVKDLREWVDAGHTREELDAMIERALDWTPQPEPTLVDQAEKKGRDKQPSGDASRSKDDDAELVWDCMADIEPEAVDWVWPGRIARGKLTLIAGDPGMGKSQIAIDITARVTKAALWEPARDSHAPSGSVLILTAEDSAADVVRPRCEAADADLRRVHRLKSVVLKDGSRRTFSLQHDLTALGKKMDEIGDVALVIVDPLTSYMGSGDKIDSHRTTDVRAVLEPLADWAEKHRVAVVGITHPPKNAPAKAIHALVGSIAFVAAARLVFLAIEEADTERRLLLAVKNNLGRLADGLGYHLEQTFISKNILASRVVWDTRPVTVTANEALAASKEDPRVLAEAKEFLRAELADSPRPATDLKKAAGNAGLSWSTVQRAQKRLGIKPRKVGLEGGWEWALPEQSQQEDVEQ